MRCLVVRTIFASAKFLVLWYHHYSGVYGTAWIGVGYDKGQACEEAAWVVRRAHFGGIPICRAHLAGYEGASGERLVAEGDSGCRAVMGLLHGLAQRKDWHVVEIDNVPGDAAWVETLFSGGPRGGV